MDLNRLKRFDKTKHDQLEQLIAWCTIMGLTGNDLISLGGHIQRFQDREEINKNMEIIKSYDSSLGTVGKDTNFDRRFTMTSIHGKYLLEDDGYRSVMVTSYTTKIRIKHGLGEWKLGRTYHWNTGWRYRALLEVHAGRIKLDF
jgi:hypothetical protein